ncbi:MAG: ABC transporter permease [Halolamina sp.]|uniref:ABC transporter permease n=1 Tax=Halolamina sp. TaxID=1940283 RepID=UPI002FC33EC5
MSSENEYADLTFRDIDFDEEEQGSGVEVTLDSLGQFLTLGILSIAYLYDYLVVPENTSMFVHMGSPVLTGWDVTSVDWMFMITLAFLLFNAIVPLYQNPRLTGYYWRQFRKNRLAVYSSWIVLGISLMGLLGPILLDPPTLSLTDSFMPPVGITARPEGTPVTGTWEYPLGTNHQGQGMLKLLVYGARVSLQIALISTLVATGIGAVVGATGAFVGGIVDEILFRYVDVQSVFPVFIFLLYLVYLFGAELYYIILLFGLFSWEGTARLVRAEALQRTEEAYVQAAEAAGASRSWIIGRHIIPNVSSTVVTVATLILPTFVLGEAALAFLGFSEPGIFSWGTTIAGGRGSLATAPWITTIPGFFLFFFVLCVNSVGDALTDAVDPRGETGE